MIPVKGYASFDPKAELKPFEFERREINDHDVYIIIKYCGICHSDIHTVRDEWGKAHHPLVPGHEIVGIVKKVGRNVSRFKEGDIVGVGCMVNSCGHCTNCENHLEQFCHKGPTFTYNSIDEHRQITQGGYSTGIVVKENFVLKIPPNLPLEKAAPLLCAGITTYSPLRRYKIDKNHKVGIVGLGGLGHMAVKLAHSFGAKVIVFTTSINKKDDAIKLGAQGVVLSNNKDEMHKQVGTFDFILDTVSAPHEMEKYISLLKTSGTLCMVGASPDPHQITSSSLIHGQKNLSGSLIGGIKETQEMLDYCGKHNITCDIEMIPIQSVNEAYARVLKSDVKYRFVIDMSTFT